MKNRELFDENESLKKRLTRLSDALKERKEELTEKDEIVGECLESMVKIGEKMHQDKLNRKEVVAKLDYLVQQVNNFVLDDS